MKTEGVGGGGRGRGRDLVSKWEKLQTFLFWEPQDFTLYVMAGIFITDQAKQLQNKYVNGESETDLLKYGRGEGVGVGVRI